ncbi:MAG: 2-phosphosulfolactate phosphatase [Ignavibacteriales bacterium]|nr:2-phosphosulfolactate phosphatase [Ignavibacteriales bacterium]
MKINVIFAPLDVEELFFTKKTTVVIDVLRATTTIATAIQNGVREVIPVNTVAFAMKVSGDAFGGQTILGGERNTKMIEGFNLGNSPLEYTPEVVSGKSVILFTTNGSKAIVQAKYSENLVTCCFNNLSVIAQHLIKLDEDILILCAGRNSMFSMEDCVCAGALIEKITESKEEVSLSDGATASSLLYKSLGKNILKMLKETEHGKLLIENGFEKDLEYCAQIDSVNVVPSFSDNVLKNMEKKESE